MQPHLLQNHRTDWWDVLSAAHDAPLQIRPLPASATVLDLVAPPASGEQRFRVGSRVCLVLKSTSTKPGHLLLLHRGTSGTVYCLCPSRFAPQTRLEAEGEFFLPQEGTGYAALQVEGPAGRDAFLAILTEATLRPQWLPAEPQVLAHTLTACDIDRLLADLDGLASRPARVAGYRGWSALATSYIVY